MITIPITNSLSLITVPEHAETNETRLILVDKRSLIKGGIYLTKADINSVIQALKELEESRKKLLSNAKLNAYKNNPDVNIRRMAEFVIESLSDELDK